MRGLGRIFKRNDVYWIAYYYRGEEYRESSRSKQRSAGADAAGRLHAHLRVLQTRRVNVATLPKKAG